MPLLLVVSVCNKYSPSLREARLGLAPGREHGGFLSFSFLSFFFFFFFYTLAHCMHQHTRLRFNLLKGRLAGL